MLEKSNKHVVLCGDSIFDNANYVEKGELDVLGHLQQLQKNTGNQASLLAVDGDVCLDVLQQVKQLPGDTSHIFVSAGGNDALGFMGVLTESYASNEELFLAIANIQIQFRERYVKMLEGVLALKLPTIVCTVYNPRYNLPDPTTGIASKFMQTKQKILSALLSLFNDVIIQEASMRNFSLIDLRAICNTDADFANPIEPSTIGAEKLAAKILQVLSEHDFADVSTRLYM
ncbi:MAG: SGNH/GDSL hydrolase family protein [Spirochaetota bacterium]